jgi:hypothetical protein
MFEIPNHDGAETSGVSGINKVTHEKLCGCTSTLAHIPHSSHLALGAGGALPQAFITKHLEAP